MEKFLRKFRRLILPIRMLVMASFMLLWLTQNRQPVSNSKPSRDQTVGQKAESQGERTCKEMQKNYGCS
jgi:hypothetical protein